MARYRFEQIAINSTEKKKPEENDRFTYLGLEHLDSGCLKVSRFGAEVAPVGEKLIMRKGDVLFGKRRAYQKKVAIAPFDGIFSAHGMVLRPREDVIDAQFFPFFISSDYFLDAAIKISVGSLSPTINWRDLKNLEFDLPTQPEQRKLAALLQAMSDTIECYKTLLTKTDELVKSQFIEMFGEPDCVRGAKYRIGDVADIQVGIVIKPSKYYSHNNKGIKAFRSLNVAPRHIIDDEWVFFSERAMAETMRTIVHAGDVLVIRTGAPGISCVVSDKYDGCNVIDLIIARPNLKLIRPEYLCVFTNMPHGKNQIESCLRGIAQKHLNVSLYSDIKIILPPIDLQIRFADFLKQLDKSKFELERALSELTLTYKRILSENLG